MAERSFAGLLFWFWFLPHYYMPLWHRAGGWRERLWFFIASKAYAWEEHARQPPEARER